LLAGLAKESITGQVKTRNSLLKKSSLKNSANGARSKRSTRNLKSKPNKQSYIENPQLGVFFLSYL
jgi:hypothetical protein